MSAAVAIGSIVLWGGNGNVPEGFLLCDGTEYSNSQSGEYGALYEVIGNNFGTPSSPDLFRVPDLRGCFVRGVDGGSGRDPDSNNRIDLISKQKVGDVVGSYQQDEFASHSHMQWSVHEGNDIGSGSYWAHMQEQTGLAGGSETRPKNIYLYYIIKYE